MRTVKVSVFAFVLSCIVFSGPIQGVLIKPANFVMPDPSGEQFRFDLIIAELSSFDAKGFQSTTQVSGPGILTFNKTASEEVSGDPSYWLVGNSAGANARDLGNSTYEFGDGPNKGNGTLTFNSIVARYAFTWDGTDGLYMFTFDFTDTNKNYVLGLPPHYESYPLQLPEGQWYSWPIVSADIDSFTVEIPEPATLVLIGLGSLVLLKKRRA